MHNFLHNHDIAGGAATTNDDNKDWLYGLPVATIRDRPVFTAYIIEVKKIRGTGSAAGSYTKTELFQIARVLFDAKSLSGNKKADAIKFLLDPERLAEIDYNNYLLAQEPQHYRR